MPSNLITQDNYNISNTAISLNKLDQFHDVSDKKEKSEDDQTTLNVTIDATRSGSIVNRRMYTATSVERKHKRFTSPNPKPVLKNHDSSDVDTAIGRITSATFERLAKTDDKFFNDFRFAKKNSPGSGRILLDAAIIDSDAQTKILDKRFLTVSTGQGLASARCSHCDNDFIDGKYCGHFPGEKETLGENSPLVKCKAAKEGAEMEVFLITDIEDYNEVSFVNVPAQQFAKIQTINDSLDLGDDKINSRFADILVSNKYAREQDCIYGMYIQDSCGTVQDLLMDDYKSDVHKLITGKTTVDFNMPAKEDEQDLSDNEDHADTTDNKNKATNDVAENNGGANTTDSINNSENETMADKSKDSEDLISKETVDILTSKITDLEAEKATLTEDLKTSNALVETLNSDKEGLAQKVIDSKADMLLTMRKVTGHSEVADLDEETEKTYLDSLKGRSIDSLTDSVTDECGTFYTKVKDLRDNAEALAGKENEETDADSTADDNPEDKEETPKQKKSDNINDIL